MTDLVRRQAEFLLYQTEDGQTRVEVRFDGETAWLSLGQMAELFQRDKSVISRHIKNVFEEGELSPASTVARSATVQQEGAREVTREVEYFNLDVIISVGYRVKSHRGTQFRIWATQHLREYIIKGFTLDDERLKRAGGGNYFDELLACIRDIRSSEKVFWRKVLDIYATSIDYDPRIEASQLFFKTVQNKMHWAAHGHTAAEIIMRDDRVFQGTALQIVRAMQDIAFGVEDFTVRKYVEWVVANALKFEGVELAVQGETDDELAASLVDEMVRTGLTRRM